MYEPIDKQLAESLSRQWSGGSEFFALYRELSAACRLGHLCIRVNEKPHGIEECPFTVYKDQRVYFKKHWEIETLFVKHIERLMGSPPNNLPCAYEERVERLLEEGRLSEEQAEAILSLRSTSIAIISGGPGTGKSYTAGQCIAALHHSLKDGESFNIVCCAPTGKAAARLQDSLNQAMSDLGEDVPIEAMTLHRLLGIVPRGTSSRVQAFTCADFILVDECSMIDSKVMSKLFAAVKPGARLLLLGDSEQLPPVESGAFFNELCELDLFPCTQLTRCLRSDLASILNVASACKSGNVQALFRALQDLEYVATDMGDVINRGVQLYSRILMGSDEEALRRINEFRILTSLRQGPFGVSSLNEAFRDRMPADAAVPIMICRSSPALGLFNGDLGVMRGGRAFFQGKVIARALLPKYEYAYCMSVHKCQGSEFDQVILLAPSGTENFGRELLYTGVTRARKSLSLWGKREVIESCLSSKTERFSGISNRLGKNFAQKVTIA